MDGAEPIIKMTRRTALPIYVMDLAICTNIVAARPASLFSAILAIFLISALAWMALVEMGDAYHSLGLAHQASQLVTRVLDVNEGLLRDREATQADLPNDGWNVEITRQN